MKVLRETPSVKAACAAAGVNRTTAYRARADDEQFAAQWQSALDEAVDVVEATAFKLASEGEPRLIEFILKAHRPSVYRERSEVAVAGGIIFLPQKSEGPE